VKLHGADGAVVGSVVVRVPSVMVMYQEILLAVLAGT